jgi:hypothetical protein
LNTRYFHLSTLFCVSLQPFYSSPVFSTSLSFTKQARWCGSVNMHQQHRFVSNPEKSGQIYKLVSFHCLQHIIPTFTPFFLYPSRKADDRQNKCNVQAVDMRLRSVDSNQKQPVCIYQYKKLRQKIMEKACQVRFRFQRLKAALTN